MTSVDIGPLSRALEQAQVTKLLIEALHRPPGRCLDFGAGYGIYVRRMRDLGYDFRWYDTYCPNLFAKGFEAEALGVKDFAVITAFEVLEHFVNPLASLQRIVSSCESFVFSTFLLPETFPSFDKWWYFGPEHGQHVSFYTRESLVRLAHSAGKRFVTNGGEVHMITSKKINNRVFRALTRPDLTRFFEYVHRRETLLLTDFEAGRRVALDQLGYGDVSERIETD